MSEPESGAPPEETAAEAAPEQRPDDPRQPASSTTVGTGSYVAVSCTLMALLLTAVLLGILFLTRWLS